MKRYILYLISCILVFAGCGESVIGYENYEDYLNASGAGDSCKILYETTDGKKISTIGKIGDANIVSNVYANNIGTIICDKPITAIYIGKFNNNTTLKAIQLPKSVEEIGNDAFKKCENLELIILPKSRHIIGDSAFEGCKKLETADNLGYATAIGNSAFKGCELLKGYNGAITLNAVEIGDEAFYGCKALKSVVFGNEHDKAVGATLRTIGNKTFYSCTSLLEIAIPDSVERIETEAFNECTSLKLATIGKSVNFIGAHAFYKCPFGKERGKVCVICKAKTPPEFEYSQYRYSPFPLWSVENTFYKIKIPASSYNQYRYGSWYDSIEDPNTTSNKDLLFVSDTSLD